MPCGSGPVEMIRLCAATGLILAGLAASPAMTWAAGPLNARAQSNTARPPGPHPLVLITQAAGFARLQPWAVKFGKLRWRGGVEISSRYRYFGGFSGLEISRDGKRIVAVSDEGWWLTAQLTHAKSMLTGVTGAAMSPILTRTGRQGKRKWMRDAESVAAWASKGIGGKLLVAFERRERIELFDFGKSGASARPRQIAFPLAITRGRFNRELESIGRFTAGPLAGHLLAVSEVNLDNKGNIRAWAWKGKKVRAFTFARLEDYLITDIAILPGGKEFLTLERGFSRRSLPGMAVRRFKVSRIKKDAVLTGEVLFSGRQPFYAIDNMEGLAVHTLADGKICLTMISDDNFNRSIQKTLILQFVIED